MYDCTNIYPAKCRRFKVCQTPTQNVNGVFFRTKVFTKTHPNSAEKKMGRNFTASDMAFWITCVLFIESKVMTVAYEKITVSNDIRS